MARERISRRKSSDVLRLTYEVGLSQRQVAASLNLATGTVAAYLSRATAAGLTWPLPARLTEEELERVLFPTQQDGGSAAPLRNDPDFATWHRELTHKGVTVLLLWEEYRAASPDHAYSSSQICARYQAWRARLKLSLRQVHKAGEKLFVDYCGPTVPVLDHRSGTRREAQIFVAVLGCSNYTFAEATWTQTLPAWIGSHVRACQFFGGVPQLLVPDNLKAGVTTPCRYAPEPNPTYAEMAAHYGTALLPARPYKPRDKAKVETGVQLVERWILAHLRHQTFSRLVERKVAIGTLLTHLNPRPFKKLPGSRPSQFLVEDQPALQPLPPHPYEYADWRTARVHLDYHVEVAGHFYSVPHRLVRQRVDVRLTVSTVEILSHGERVASHPRSARKGGFPTVPAHLPLSHQRHLEWTPGRLLNWAQTIGPHTRVVVQHLLEKRYPEQGYRSGLGRLNLGKGYGPSRLEFACQKATDVGAYTRRSVASILEHGLALLSPAPPPDAAPPLEHENLRGPTSYH